MDKSYTTGLAV